MEDYLKTFHDEDVTDLLNSNSDAIHVSVKINLTQLYQQNRDLFFKLVRDPHEECLKWNHSLFEIQKSLIEGNMFLEDGYQIKENCYVRFVNLPNFDNRPNTLLPNAEDVGKFLQVKGNIVRMTKTRLLELKREFICSKCKQKVVIMAEYSKMFVIEALKACKTDFCKGMLYPVQANPKPEFCIDYQEVRIQEIMSDRNIPASMVVTFENDLADLCQPGDCITVCGTVERRWKPLVVGKKTEVVITMRAISVVKEEIIRGRDLPEQLICVRAQWHDTVHRLGELNARDLILKSIAPEVHGMLLPKLAVALLLCSGGEQYQSRGTSIRGNSHVLLVGDPGLAKTKLLKHASKISRRSVYTTGMGCSQAGLTAAAIRESNEWQLEAGALVLADGGICCIDEFNLMRETDKGSIHEAMEQQCISMAKAGVVCKLSTRCSILAATNNKKGRSLELDEMGYIDVGIASPLLSRFDIVLVLRDPSDRVWDELIADHILGIKIANNTKNVMNLDELQSHFLAIKSIHPEMTDRANQLLGNYYKFCRSDSTRDPGRTTMRMFDSLIRLSQSHARLLFRSKVTVRDAATAVMLIESSLGFGKLFPPIDTVQKSMPLGPINEEIKNILERLEMEYVPEEDDDNSNNLNTRKDYQDFPTSTSNNNNSMRSSFFPINDDEDLDEILSLNMPEPVKQPVMLMSSTPDTMNDCLNIEFPVPNHRSSPPLSIVQKPKKNKRKHLRPIIDESENLDEILDLNDFDVGPNKKPKPSTSKQQKSANKANIENQYKPSEKKKIRKNNNEPVEVPREDICNIVNILSGIRESFLVSQREKNLQLSTTQDIDLDEIFGNTIDEENDEISNEFSENNRYDLSPNPIQSTPQHTSQFEDTQKTATPLNELITPTVTNSTQFTPPISIPISITSPARFSSSSSSTSSPIVPTKSILSDKTIQKLNAFRNTAIVDRSSKTPKTPIQDNEEVDSAIDVDNSDNMFSPRSIIDVLNKDMGDDLSFLNLDF